MNDMETNPALATIVTAFAEADFDRLLGRIRKTIGRLLADRPLAARLGAAARQRAFAEFSIETQARRYEDFYRALFESKRRSMPRRNGITTAQP